jgi:hypothetical protein
MSDTESTSPQPAPAESTSPEPTPTESTASQPTPSVSGLFAGFLMRELPYVVMIVLAVVGVAYTNLVPGVSLLYWQILAGVYGLICVLIEWPRLAPEPKERLRLVVTQVLHWGAFLLAMRLLFLPTLQKNLTSELTGLVLVYVLALSTFLAGIYINWRLAVVGVFLWASLVAIAFVELANALIIVLALLVIAGIWLWNRFEAQTQS